MNSRSRMISIVVLALLVPAASTRRAGAQAASQPTDQNPRIQALFAALKPGMLRTQALQLALKWLEKRPSGDMRFGDGGGISRFTLDDRSSVIFEYLPGENDQHLAAFNVVRFDDLRKSAGEESFENLKLIHLSPSLRLHDFDPAALIRAVNGLHPQGKEKSLAALRAYAELSRDHRQRFIYDLDEQRVFLILRVLFVNANGDPKMPWMRIGAPNPAVGPDDNDWPLFPLAVVHDIPFRVVDGYRLGGSPESPLVHADYCEQNCVLRKQPLRPSASPLAAVEAICNSPAWSRLFATREEAAPTALRLRAQALRAVAGVLGTQPVADVSDDTWPAMLQDPRLQKVTWESSRFVADR